MIFALQLEFADEGELVLDHLQIEVVGVVSSEIQMRIARRMVEKYAAFCRRPETPSRGLERQTSPHLIAEKVVIGANSIVAVSANRDDVRRGPIKSFSHFHEAQSDQVFLLKAGVG